MQSAYPEKDCTPHHEYSMPQFRRKLTNECWINKDLPLGRHLMRKNPHPANFKIAKPEIHQLIYGKICNFIVKKLPF